jgi:hypothetical protein
MTQTTSSDSISVIKRTFEAANRHDLEAFLEYFHPKYQSEADRGWSLGESAAARSGAETNSAEIETNKLL